MKLQLSLRRSEINPGQWAALRSEEPLVCMTGGFGSGKTTGISLKLLQYKSLNPGVPGLIAAQSMPQMWGVVIPRIMSTLRRALPSHLMPRVRDRTQNPHLDFGDGVPIYLRSATRPSSMDGIDAGFGLADEIRHWPKHSWEVFISRVRLRSPFPQVFAASTPGMGWMANEFNTGKRNRALIRAPTRENAHNLAPGYIDNLKLSYSKRMQDAVLEGLFVILEGAVYEAVAADLWNSQWAVSFKPDWANKTYLAVDPGYRRSSWLLIQEVKPQKWVVFDEHMGETMSDEANVEVIKEKLKHHGCELDEIWTDPAADATQSALNLDTIDMLKLLPTRSDEPIKYITGPYRSLGYGVDKMRVLLGDPESGLPIRVRFAKNLESYERNRSRGIVKDLLSYRYPDEKPGRRAFGPDPLKDGITDHSNDALRYWGIGMWLTSGLRDILEKARSSNERQRGRGYKAA